MRQVVLTAPKQIEFREVAAPEAGNLKSDEVLLRILRIGICGSEIHSYHGQHPATFYPVVQGHEYSAEVVAVGSAVRKVKPGDRVTGRPQLVCGECNPCKRGQYNVCSNLRVEAFQADGVAQDYFVIPEERVVALPEGMSPDYGAMVEPTAVAAHATSRPRALEGRNVVVSGAGTIGNLVAQFARARCEEGGHHRRERLPAFKGARMRHRAYAQCRQGAARREDRRVVRRRGLPRWPSSALASSRRCGRSWLRSRKAATSSSSASMPRIPP